MRLIAHNVCPLSRVLCIRCLQNEMSIVDYILVLCCALFTQALDVQRERKRFENQRFAVQRCAGRLAAVLSGMSCAFNSCHERAYCTSFM